MKLELSHFSIYQSQITMASLTLAKPADLTIPKLTTDNYKPWKELVMAALEGRGVWEYADGTEAEPDDVKEKKIWR